MEDRKWGKVSVCMHGSKQVLAVLIYIHTHICTQVTLSLTHLQSADPVNKYFPSSLAAIHVTTLSCSLSCTENTSRSWSASTLCVCEGRGVRGEGREENERKEGRKKGCS